MTTFETLKESADRKASTTDKLTEEEWWVSRVIEARNNALGAHQQYSPDEPPNQPAIDIYNSAAERYKTYLNLLNQKRIDVPEQYQLPPSPLQERKA